MNSSRIKWIDTLKGLGILLVVFAHLSPALPIEKFIYSFHMFLFFFISGFLYSDRNNISFKKVVSQKARRLLLPFLFWDVTSCLYIYLCGTPIKTVFKQFFFLDGEYCWNAPIWFLWILFVVESIYIVINGCQLSISITFLIPILCLVFAYISRDMIVPLKLNIAPIGLLFYWFGTVSKKVSVIKKLEENYLISFTIFLLATVILSHLNDRISLFGAYYGNFLLCVICGVCGILQISLLARRIHTQAICSALQMFGRDSMFIMCFQYPVFLFLSNCYAKINNSQFDLWHYRSTRKALVMSIISMIIIYAFLLIAKKLLPRKICKTIGVHKSR